MPCLGKLPLGLPNLQENGVLWYLCFDIAELHGEMEMMDFRNREWRSERQVETSGYEEVNRPQVHVKLLAPLFLAALRCSFFHKVWISLTLIGAFDTPRSVSSKSGPSLLGQRCFQPLELLARRKPCRTWRMALDTVTGGQVGRGLRSRSRWLNGPTGLQDLSQTSLLYIHSYAW